VVVLLKDQLYEDITMLSELVEHVEDQLSNSLGSPKVSLCLLLTLLAALGMSVCGCKTMALHGDPEGY